MSKQPEQILENNLVKQLTGLRHAYVHITNEDGIRDDIVGGLDSIAIKMDALKPSVTVNVENMGVGGASDINAIAQELFELSQTVG